MKARIFCLLVVFALVSVSFGQKRHEVKMAIVVPATVQLDQPMEIKLSMINEDSKSVTLREVELYCGTSDHRIWEKIGTFNRVTVRAGEVCPFTVTYTPSCEDVQGCAGDWSLQGWMCFGGSGKSDLMTPYVTFTVTE